LFTDFIKHIKLKYNISDIDMFMLFGISKEAHYVMLKLHPEWNELVREMDSIL